MALTVEVSDGTATASQSYTIAVMDVDEAPVATAFAATVDEKLPADQLPKDLGLLVGSDPDGFSIIRVIGDATAPGADALSIDPSNGHLMLTKPLD